MTTEIMEKVQERKAEISSAAAVSARRALPEIPNLEQLMRKTTPIPVIAVNEGSLLVADGLVLTKKSRLFVHGWVLLEDKRAREIEVDLREGGWHFFYLIPDVEGAGIADVPNGPSEKHWKRYVQKVVRMA